MQKKTLVITLIVIILATVLIITLTKINEKTLSPQTQILEECKTLNYNGEDKISIVFFSSKELAKEYSDFLLTITPFKENPNAFNFFYIDDYSPECELYKDIAVLCQEKELIKKASSCPNDYIVVLKDLDSNIRSSAYMNVMSLNSNHQLSVFPHELGHALANLAEEYAPANIPRNSENCQSSCDEFDINDGCFLGCSKSNYYRSINSGIMRTLSSSNYGIFDERIILEKIFKKTGSHLTGLAIEENIISCTDKNYLLIEGILNLDNIEIIDKSVETGCLGTNGAGDFSYNLILEDNSILTSGEFNPELIFTDSQEENQEYIDGETFISDQPFLLKIPIIKNSKTLEISKEGETLSEINLQNIGNQFCKIK